MKPNPLSKGQSLLLICPSTLSLIAVAKVAHLTNKGAVIRISKSKPSPLYDDKTPSPLHPLGTTSL